MVYYVHSITKYGLTWHSVAQRIGKPTTRMPRPAEKVLSTKRRAANACTRKALGWPKRSKLAHAFMWEYSYKRLKLAR